MRPVNLGNSVSTVQWENENEIRWYPFEQGASDLDAAGVVSDLSIMVNQDGPMSFRLGSVHVGPGMVSMSVSAGEYALVCTVLKADFEPYRPYPMTSVSGECGGMCSFGDVDFSNPFTRKFDGDGPLVLQTVVARVETGKLKGFKDDVSGKTISGEVEFRFPSDTIVKRENYVSDLDVGTISVEMSSELNGRLVSPCDSQDRLSAGKLSPIRSINGIEPDENGRIAVVFE